MTLNDVKASLSRSCMLVSLVISQWSGRKLDKTVTREANDLFQANHDAGRYNKSLVAPKSLARVTAAAGAIRAAHYCVTLPWLDGGARVLSAQAYFQYVNAVKQSIAAFDAAADEFTRDYPGLVANAQRDLGRMFDPRQYPSQLTIRDRFKAQYAVLPFPDAADFRVEGLNGDLAAIRAQIEEQQAAMAVTARAEIFERIREVAERVVERLRGYTGTKGGAFRDSLIENGRDLVTLLPLLNVTGDPIVASLTADLDRLSRVDPGTLRESSVARESAANEADAILAKMAAFL